MKHAPTVPLGATFNMLKDRYIFNELYVLNEFSDPVHRPHLLIVVAIQVAE